MSKPIKTLEEIFPYEYVGGGYFRKKGVAKGDKADIIHGPEVPKFIYDALTKKEDE
jgi:hypothetical protein